MYEGAKKVRAGKLSFEVVLQNYFSGEWAEKIRGGYNYFLRDDFVLFCGHSTFLWLVKGKWKQI